MKTMRLGKTGLAVSRVGIGGIPLTRPAPDDAAALVRHALDRGITFIDTAFGYRDSEDRIGQGIAGQRDKVVLATKTPARDRQTALEHLDTSLRRLGTDHVDIWQLHGVTSFESMRAALAPGGAYEAAREAVQAGKVGHIGVSSHNVDVAAGLVRSGLFEVIQVPLNFISDESATSGLLDLCRQHDVGYIAMKPFAGGNIRSARLALSYLLEFDNVLPDPGVERPGEIDEIAAIVEAAEPPTAGELAEMRRLKAAMGQRFCRQCEYCMPCPQGVIIPGMMYLPKLYELWPPERFFSWQLVLRSVEGAANCVECGECEQKCPYKLPIRQMIVEHLDFYGRVKKEWDARQVR
jgi:hypothetical protein